LRKKKPAVAKGYGGKPAAKINQTRRKKPARLKKIKNFFPRADKNL